LVLYRQVNKGNASINKMAPSFMMTDIHGLMAEDIVPQKKGVQAKLGSC
jgi:hypothetical protein